MNLDAYLAELVKTGKAKPCIGCKRTDGLTINLMAEGMHWGRIECLNCDHRFVTWAPKPDKPRRPRDGKSKHLLGIIREAWAGEPLYCEICLRDERELTDTWMEAHHVLERQDGGFDDPSNLRPLCRECHELIHWRRRAVHGAQVGKEAVAA